MNAAGPAAWRTVFNRWGLVGLVLALILVGAVIALLPNAPDTKHALYVLGGTFAAYKATVEFLSATANDDEPFDRAWKRVHDWMALPLGALAIGYTLGTSYQSPLTSAFGRALPIVCGALLVITLAVNKWWPVSKDPCPHCRHCSHCQIAAAPEPDSL